MQFRWVALISLWTMLVGPVFGPPPGSPPPAAKRPADLKAKS